MATFKHTYTSSDVVDLGRGPVIVVTHGLSVKWPHVSQWWVSASDPSVITNTPAGGSTEYVDDDSIVIGAAGDIFSSFSKVHVRVSG